MIIAFLLTGTMLPAALSLLEPRGEQDEIGLMKLAPADRFLRNRRAFVLGGFSALLAVGIALLPHLRFDANPLHLRSTRTESMATLLELMRDPATSLEKIDVLSPSLEDASRLAQKVAKLPGVAQATTLRSFVPEDQEQKLAVISDAQTILDPTLTPIETKAPPTRSETLASIARTQQALQRVAAKVKGAGAEDANRLALILAKLETAPPQVLDAAEKAVVAPLETTLARARAALTAGPVTLESLPQDLRSDWIAPDGRAHVEITPKSQDDDFIETFTAEIQSAVPQATGALVLIEESRHTIVQAFLRAGALSLISVVMLLALLLRRPRDVVLTLVPLLAIAVLTFATCVAARMQLNFANIIVLPLLLGIGVAFSIYFVMFWRGGGRDFLQSSLTRAVIYSAATTASGFGALWFSSHPGTASMGLLLMICLAWTMVITLFLVPALLNKVPAPVPAE
jgi:hopanoid biosynthesis associated RND transporter like protein HpnN